MKKDITKKQDNSSGRSGGQRKTIPTLPKAFTKNADDYLKSSFIQESHYLMKTSRLSLEELIDAQLKLKTGVGSNVWDFEFVQRIVEATCRYYGVSFFDLHSRSRKRDFVTPRQIILCLLAESKSVNRSLNEIGSLFNRDHSTVLHAQKTIYNLEYSDKYIRTTMVYMRESFRSFIATSIGNDSVNGHLTKEAVFFALLNSVGELKKIDADHWTRMYKEAAETRRRRRKEVSDA